MLWIILFAVVLCCCCDQEKLCHLWNEIVIVFLWLFFNCSKMHAWNGSRCSLGNSIGSVCKRISGRLHIIRKSVVQIKYVSSHFQYRKMLSSVTFCAPSLRLLNIKIRVTTCLENLEMLGNLTAVREMSGILMKITELSEKNLSGKSYLKLFIVNCIFVSIQVFTVLNAKYMVSDHVLLHSYPHHWQ